MEDLGIRVLFQGNNFLRLCGGLLVSLRIAAGAMALSLPFGYLMGILMAFSCTAVKRACRLYLETVRIMPQLVLLFLVYFGAAANLGINISGEAAALAVFTFWGTAEMGDLVRSALISVPKHQYDSGFGLGLSRVQVYLLVIFPQTARSLIPPSVNLFTRMIKTTSLVVLMGVVDVIKAGKQIIDASRYDSPSAALWVYAVIFFMYFIVCYPFSRLSAILERKMKD